MDGGVTPKKCGDADPRSPLSSGARAASMGSSRKNSRTHSSLHNDGPDRCFHSTLSCTCFHLKSAAESLSTLWRTVSDCSPRWCIFEKKCKRSTSTDVPGGCSEDSTSAVTAQAKDAIPPSAAIGRPRRRSHDLTRRMRLRTSGRPSKASCKNFRCSRARNWSMETSQDMPDHSTQRKIGTRAASTSSTRFKTLSWSKSRRLSACAADPVRSGT
mmetsp:Transcript_73083/g.138903  ORF Transcript_73083/g.138903 Transcript_73083/m.138903 type:complete len:214 (+) Transcript_73083:1485-2126(+)